MVCIRVSAEYKVDSHRKDEILKPEWNLIVWELSSKQNICHDSTTFPSNPYGEQFSFHVCHKHHFYFIFFLLSSGPNHISSSNLLGWKLTPASEQSNPLLSLLYCIRKSARGLRFAYIENTFVTLKLQIILDLF